MSTRERLPPVDTTGDGIDDQHPATVMGADGEALVVDVLTEAFTGDPLMQWLFPGAAAHVAALRTWWGHLVGRRAASAELWALDAAGAALWYAPREGSDDDGDPDGAAAFVEMLASLVVDRLGEALDFLRTVVASHPAEPHWYLAAVGTRPARQGEGVGAAILAPVLERCDAHGIGAYLEASNPRNVPFYHRLGFVETGVLHTPDASASMTLMWRSAR